jgi:hypothetical protein
VHGASQEVDVLQQRRLSTPSLLLSPSTPSPRFGSNHLAAALDQPITSAAQLHRLPLPEHVARLVRACWLLGRQPATAALGLRRWAHMLGYGGHCLTKSHHYSTTFRALRAARRAFTARRRHGPTVALDRDGRLLPPAGMVSVAGWEYAGCGYTTTPMPGWPPPWPPTTNKHFSSPARN